MSETEKFLAMVLSAALIGFVTIKEFINPLNNTSREGMQKGYDYILLE